jgi:hypothetical protein
MQPELLFEVRVAPSSKQRSGDTMQPLANDAHAHFPVSLLDAPMEYHLVH